MKKFLADKLDSIKFYTLWYWDWIRWQLGISPFSPATHAFLRIATKNGFKVIK